MEAKKSTRKCFWQRVEIIHRTDNAMAAILMRKRVHVPLEKSAFAMSDQFQFNSAWCERFDAKLAEHDG